MYYIILLEIERSFPRKCCTNPPVLDGGGSLVFKNKTRATKKAITPPGCTSSAAALIGAAMRLGKTVKRLSSKTTGIGPRFL